MLSQPEAPKPETPVSSDASGVAAIAAHLPPAVLDLRHVAQLRAMRIPGRPSLFQELCVIFQREAPERMQKLAAAVDAHEAEHVGKLAHAMVGSLSTLGARRMQHAAKALELAAFAGEWSRIPAAHNHVRECWTELEQVFDQQTKEDCA